ncbi:short-chain dehydrogenase/reductase SDR [Leptothrix cholodnii SP-6]|uniref:Short-chain dehydrogenase/reductase SDR n=1 Tax=Leptothrix cholodnii (strain ATCC 51168 / LMG 8142 / SP-6) TaxID=395495 RepID=B1Y134_LEPCP|nr:SDR family oxidoreductase [Leptothrix cholodnii]ACB35451.1 short-chain dehydrogenase/reductase SDR [Leptothrix cholodnii SP-6]
MPATLHPASTPTHLAAAGSLLLITGGSRGIGAATARLAAQAGWHVVLGYASDAAAAEAVVAELHALGVMAWALQADVADEAAVGRLFSQVDTLCARNALVLRGLANNAGVVDRAQRLDEMSGERLRRMVAVNLLGSLYCAREAVRRMSTRHGGTGGAIVNLSSVAGRLGAPGQYVDYAATKGAIDTFTLGLAREVATEGVRVNAVRPGVIDTEIHASGGQPERAWQLAPQIPMQRPGAADEVAQAVVWLLSPAASYTTGAVLDVTGGR